MRVMKMNGKGKLLVTQKFALHFLILATVYFANFWEHQQRQKYYNQDSITLINCTCHCLSFFPPLLVLARINSNSDSDINFPAGETPPAKMHFNFNGQSAGRQQFTLINSTYHCFLSLILLFVFPIYTF